MITFEDSVTVRFITDFVALYAAVSMFADSAIDSESTASVLPPNESVFIRFTVIPIISLLVLPARISAL